MMENERKEKGNKSSSPQFPLQKSNQMNKSIMISIITSNNHLNMIFTMILLRFQDDFWPYFNINSIGKLRKVSTIDFLNGDSRKLLYPAAAALMSSECQRPGSLVRDLRSEVSISSLLNCKKGCEKSEISWSSFGRSLPLFLRN